MLSEGLRINYSEKGVITESGVVSLWNEPREIFEVVRSNQNRL